MICFMEDGLSMDNGFNQMDNGFQQPYVQPNAEQGFVQPDYNAGQAYAQPSYDGYPNQQVNGWNNYPTNNFQPANQFAESEPSVVKCPGKEITGMVFGISALLMGLIGYDFFAGLCLRIYLFFPWYRICRCGNGNAQ